MFLVSIYMEIIKRFDEGLWDARSCSHSDVKQHFDDCGGLEIIKRFDEGLWDARSCSHSDVKQHFDDCGGLGADFPTFYTLYHHAACEFITPPGDKLVKK